MLSDCLVSHANSISCQILHSFWAKVSLLLARLISQLNAFPLNRKGHILDHLTQNIVWNICSSVAESYLTLCDPMNCSTPGFPVLHYLPEFAQTHVHWVGDAIQPSHPLPPPYPLPFSLSHHQGLVHESALHITWPKYWGFSSSISPSNEYSKLISFRMDWLDLRAGQGTLKNLLQHHSSKASVLHHSAFFRVQLSHPYMTTGKTIALTRQTFVGKMIVL